MRNQWIVTPRPFDQQRCVSLFLDDVSTYQLREFIWKRGSPSSSRQRSRADRTNIYRLNIFFHYFMHRILPFASGSREQEGAAAIWRDESFEVRHADDSIFDSFSLFFNYFLPDSISRFSLSLFLFNCFLPDLISRFSLSLLSLSIFLLTYLTNFFSFFCSS